MHYICNWVKKELNPTNIQKSLTTNSIYFTINNVNIRISDHITDKNECAFQIIIVKGITVKDKQYIVKEKNNPNLMYIRDVKSLKIVIATLLFHYSNIYNVKEVKNNIKNKNINLANSYIDKLQHNEENEITDFEISAFGSYISAKCEQYRYFTKSVKLKIAEIIKFGKSIDDIIDIINIVFPIDKLNEWYKRPNNKSKLDNYLYANNIITIDKNAELNNDSIPNVKPDYYLKCLETYNKWMELDQTAYKTRNKTELYVALGNMLGFDINNIYSKVTTGQKNIIRSLVDVKIDYNTIVTFINKTLSYKDKHIYPNYAGLKQIVNRFLELYNIGIIKYPDEEDFFTYNIDNKNNIIKNVESEFTDRQLNIINMVLNSNTINEKK